MTDAELLLRWFVLGLAWILALNVLVFGVLLLVDVWRNPPGWWVRWRIPDFIPDNWGGDRKSDLSAKRTVRGDGPRQRR